MEKRYFLIGFVLSKESMQLAAGHSAISCRDYPSRKDLLEQLSKENPDWTISILSICEQSEEDQKAFLAE